MSAILSPTERMLELKSEKVRDVLFSLMRELGMTKIFVNVGSTEETFLQDFPSDFEYILSRHESVGVAMADAYSQATGKPVHVNLHTAAGSGNAWAAYKRLGTTAAQ